MGCSGNLNTPTYTDVCGIECGDNSTCSLIEDNFVSTEFSSMLTTTYADFIDFYFFLKANVDVVVIPSGSRNIKIEEMTRSNSYISEFVSLYPLRCVIINLFTQLLKIFIAELCLTSPWERALLYYLVPCSCLLIQIVRITQQCLKQMDL